MFTELRDVRSARHVKYQFTSYGATKYRARVYVYIYIYIYRIPNIFGGTRWRSWLRHYATSRKVTGSIPDEVTGFFQLNLSSRTMALRSAQPLIEISTRYLPEVKGGRRVRLTSPL
jgi:hypothetical protein